LKLTPTNRPIIVFLLGPHKNANGNPIGEVLNESRDWTAAWLVIALAPDVTAVYAGRSLQGAGVGAATLALALYAAEALEPAVRGSLGLAPATAGNAGILLCCALGRRLDWRRLAAVAALLPVLLLVGAPFLVETPRWLVSKGTPTLNLSSLHFSSIRYIPTYLPVYLPTYLSTYPFT